MDPAAHLEAAAIVRRPVETDRPDGRSAVALAAHDDEPAEAGEARGPARDLGEVELDEVARVARQPWADPGPELCSSRPQVASDEGCHERGRQRHELQPGRQDRLALGPMLHGAIPRASMFQSDARAEPGVRC